MTFLSKIFRRRVKNGDPELEQFRQLLEIPDSFDEGFNLTSLVGTLFVALVMVPGALYMELVAGTGIGGAAQWVTVLLFVEVAKRANAKLSRAQLFVLFYMSGMIMGRSSVGSLLFSQFLVRSDAAIATGIAPLLPAWVAPTNLDALPRTFLIKPWLPVIGLIIFREMFGRFDSAILGYGLFRLTSDIERLPFPMAPIGAQASSPSPSRSKAPPRPPAPTCAGACSALAAAPAWSSASSTWRCPPSPAPSSARR